jgi:hypothetical protein
VRWRLIVLVHEDVLGARRVVLVRTQRRLERIGDSAGTERG